MLTLSSDVMQAWIAGLLWPLSRILAMIAIAPIFGNQAVPPTVKVILGVFITLIIAPTLPALPHVELFSLAGVLILLQQMMIGLATGFIMQLVFSAIDLAGQISGMTMGLGFASFFDPQTQGQSTAISQLFVMIAMLLFLNLNGHLILLMALAESFTNLPISANAGSGLNLMNIVSYGEVIFSAGLHLSLPIIAVLLITNLALGILSRSAPQLNLFGIGFPVTLSIGFLVMALVLPRISAPLENMMQHGYEVVRQLGNPAPLRSDATD